MLGLRLSPSEREDGRVFIGSPCEAAASVRLEISQARRPSLRPFSIDKKIMQGDQAARR
jgi:hypothetical protein